MGKDCAPRSNATDDHLAWSSQRDQPLQQESLQPSNITSPTTDPTAIYLGMRESRSIAEIVFCELIRQLPSLPSPEAFDLGHEVDKQLRRSITASKMSSIRFRRMSLCDTLSLASITILDFVCYLAPTSEVSLRYVKRYKGTVVIVQRDASASAHASIVHATTPHMSLNGRGTSVQEWRDLSFHLQLFGGDKFNEEKNVLQNTFFNLHKEEWGDTDIDEELILPNVFTAESRSSGSNVAAAIRRLCSWGAVAAWLWRDDYRFFSTCVLGIFCRPIIDTQKVGEISDLSFKAIPLFRARGEVHGKHR